MDYLYLYAKQAGISIWPYCLMDNHVHLISVSKQKNNFVSDEIKNWADYLTEEDDKSDLVLFRNHSNTGRPLDDKEFVALLEKISGGMLHRRKPGPKRHKDN